MVQGSRSARFWLKWSLPIIVLVGFGLRIIGIGYGLPYTYNPDEPTLIEISIAMLKTGDLNPHFFGYPSVIFYLNALVYLVYFLIAHAFGWIGSIADLSSPEVVTMGVGRELTPNLLLLGRGLTAFFSTGCIVLTYWIGRKLDRGVAVGLIGATLVAVSPTALGSSQAIASDSFALFFSLLSFAGAIQILQGSNLSGYIIAGVGAGLAISSKYNVGLIPVAMIAAHLLRWGWQGIRRKELWIGLVVCVAAFLLATPFLIVDLPVFIKTFGFSADVYISQGHAGQEGNSLQWYPLYLMQAEGVYILLAVLQSIRLLWARSKIGLVLLSFPVIYFIVISQMMVRNQRTVMQIIPLLALLSAILLVEVYRRARQAPLSASWIMAASLLVGGLIIYSPLQESLATDAKLVQSDGRESARQWLETNLPEGSRVAVEAYAPYLNRERYVVQGIDALVDKPPQWYPDNGFEYLIFSQGMYGRFFSEPDKYSFWIDKYNQIFSRFELVKLFNDNHYEIRVYKTGAALPSHRVAARFGNAGEWIELLGYDEPTSAWTSGQPFSVNLVWRTLAEQSEPLTIELRLLDKNDREIGRASGDLFQGQGWREGAFSTPWTISVQGDPAPGLYRLQLNVVQARFAYTLPVKNSAGDAREQPLLGPIKMGPAPWSTVEREQSRPTNVRFGEQVMLVGYHVRPDARAGDSVPLKLYWQSITKPSHDYTFFIHLIDENGAVLAQLDAQPWDGAYPTSLWDVGERVPDTPTLKLPASLPPGSYRLEIGWYEYPSQARLSASDENRGVSGEQWVLPDRLQVSP